jgi:cytochrome c oxidase subunit 1
MHILGLIGMPRRVYTYPAEMGWGGYNLVATVGAYTMAAGVACLVVNLIVSLRKGEKAPANPWDAPSLEWAAASPPRPYNFPNTPVVDSHAPLWTNRDALPVLSGLSSDKREVLVTTAVEADPDNRQESPKPSLWPLVSAIAATILLIGSMFSEWALVWGAVPLAIAFTGWFWPNRRRRHEAKEAVA